MATMTIKNLPDDLYELLKQSAEQHRRSINSEAVVCLERALKSERIDPEELLAKIREHRARMSKVWVTDEDIRTAREQGRP